VSLLASRGPHALLSGLITSFFASPGAGLALAASDIAARLPPPSLRCSCSINRPDEGRASSGDSYQADEGI
jgi:hypothetical protein